MRAGGRILLTKTPKNALPSWPPLWPDKAHRVEDGDNWWKLAAMYGRQDPWDIIQFNFNTKVPEEVNYYLAKLVGCTKSNDGKNYSFSSADAPGLVYIPPRSWRPEYGPYEKTNWKSCFEGALYEGGLDMERTAGLLNRLQFVEVPDLTVPCEYDYGHTVYVRPQREQWDFHWAVREGVHIALGPFGQGRPFTPQNDATAWMQVRQLWGGNGVLAKLPFPFHEARVGHAQKSEIWRAAGVCLAMKGTFAESQRFRELTAVVRRDPDCLRRLAGKPPGRR
jgi:hypothetical protein